MRALLFSLLIIAFLISLGSTAYCQEQSKEYKWKAPAKYETIPDTFHSMDVVVISREMTLAFVSDVVNKKNIINTNYLLRIKFKALTQKGIKECTRFDIPRQKSTYISILDARTIKPDGEVVDLDSRNIHELDISDENKTENSSPHMRVSIPGVEVNDEVELIILQNKNGIDTHGEFFLNDPTWYCLKASYTIALPLGAQTDVKCYNYMPHPKVDSTNELKLIQWKQEALRPLQSEYLSIPYQEFPFIRYVIRSVPYHFLHPDNGLSFEMDLEPTSWGEYAKAYMDMKFAEPGFIGRKMARHFDRLYDDYITYNKNPDTLFRIIHFYNFIHDSMKIAHISESEFEGNADYYLKRNEVTQSFMIYFFDRMFVELKMNYFLGLAQGRYTGDFDKDFVGTAMATSSFVAFESGKSLYYFFLPQYGYSFEFGEIPFDVQGTEAIIFSKNKIQVPVREVTIPAYPKEKNFISSNIFLNINLQTKKAVRKERTTLSGAVSYYYRGFTLEAIHQNKLREFVSRMEEEKHSGYVLDSVKAEKFEHKPPFLFTTQKNLHKEGVVEEMEKGVYSIPLTGVIVHSMLPYVQKARSCAYYPYYAYSDSKKAYLVFSQPIQLINSDQIKKAWNGKLGSYTLKVAQLTETTLMIESTYTIDATRIDADDYPLIGKLNEEAKNVSDLQVIIRIK
jgi:hypothetical protein